MNDTSQMDTVDGYRNKTYIYIYNSLTFTDKKFVKYYLLKFR